MNEDEGIKNEDDNDQSQDEWDEAFSEGANTEETNEDDSNEDDQESSESDGDSDSDEDELSGGDDSEDDQGQVQQRTVDPVDTQGDEALNAIIQDIYPDEVPNPLVDADGDPIKGVSDMLNLVNPNTGEPFTYDQARAWMDERTNQYQSAIAERTNEARAIMANNEAVSSGAEEVKSKYGKILGENPELASQLIQTYKKTLSMTESGNVKAAPVDIREFYDIALKPYLSVQQKQQKQETVKRTRADRADISGNVETDDRSDSDKEWDNAFREVLGK